MKFIATTDGYINADYVRRLFVKNQKIYVETAQDYLCKLDESFDTDGSAQNYLDELIEELEGDNNVD